jgi:hypothetical protein
MTPVSQGIVLRIRTFADVPTRRSILIGKVHGHGHGFGLFTDGYDAQ